MKKRFFSLLLAALSLGQGAQAQEGIRPEAHAQQQTEKMQWFQDAKLGIFVHWGIYAVNGVSESWSFYHNYLSHKDYMRQCEGFTAKQYDAGKWAELMAEAGARYAVLTTKHHDGLALWDTKTDGLSTVKNTPAARDLVGPFAKAVREKGMKVGLYYSLIDWTYPDYDVHTGSHRRYQVKDEPARWNKFLNFYQTQLSELSAQYNPDLYWFDGDWEHSAQEWESEKVRKMLQGYNAGVILNSRLAGHGDYDTPEQGVPVTAPQGAHWELCMTMNNAWGYQPFDNNYKTPNQMLRIFVDCISMGGNLLLDIGPKEDGSIPAEQVAILKEIGRWNKLHAPAVYGTRRGIPKAYVSDKTALSADGRTLYIYLERQPTAPVVVRGLHNRILKAEVLGSKTALSVDYLPVSAGDPAWASIAVPQQSLDPAVTVLALELDGPIRMQTAQELAAVARPKPAKKAPKVAYTLLSADNKADTLQWTSAWDRAQVLAATAIAKQAGKGLTLGVALDKKGQQPAQAQALATELKAWAEKHQEVMQRPTKAGLPDGHFSGPTALSADGQTLYLFVQGKPSGPLVVKGLKNKIHRTRIVGEGSILNTQEVGKQYWSHIPGLKYIDLPASRCDEHMTVVALLLDGPVSLFREQVGAIENNL